MSASAENGRRVPVQCDVVVIGGGPSGSTTASALAQRGYDVVLLEKAKHPRLVVGESLIPHFWVYADQIGASEKIAADGFLAKAGGTVCWDGKIRQMSFRDFGFTRPALHVERDRFDKILLDHAVSTGVRVVENVKAGRVRSDEKASTVDYVDLLGNEAGAITARFVVDASGQASLLARQMGERSLDDAFRFMSIWGYFRNSKYVAADGCAHPVEDLSTLPPTTTVVSLGDWGWSWHIPLRESTSVGIVIPVEKVRDAKDSEAALESYFLRTCRSTPLLGQLLKDAELIADSVMVIRDFSYRPGTIAGPGFFVVGDAAAFVDPIFSIGVVYGMFSGAIAATTIDQCLRRPGETDRLQRFFTKMFVSRLGVSRSLALPGLDSGERIEQMVRSEVEFFGDSEKSLMAVVSGLTNRSTNFTGIFGRERQDAQATGKFRELAAVEFP